MKTGFRFSILGALLQMCFIFFFGEVCLAQPWFMAPYTLYYKTGWGYIRYGDYLLSMGDMDRDGIPDLLFSFCERFNQPPNYPLYYRTRIAFGKRPGTIDASRWCDVDGYGTLATGDFNGDGLPDLVAQRFDEEVSVMLGCSHCQFAIDTLPAWRMEGNTIEFGEFIAIGDLNDDGSDDIVVTSPNWFDSTRTEVGKVHVYFGRPGPPPITDHETQIEPDLEVTLKRKGWRYGWNGLWIGDVNGDGRKDLIVGVDYPKAQIEDSDGYIDVYYGGPGFKIDPEHPDQRVGREILPPPADPLTMRWNLNLLDVNNDGIQDLFVCKQTAGYVFYGGPGGFHAQPDRVIIPPDTNYFHFWSRVYRMGDVNGDQYDDYAVQINAESFGMWHIANLFIYLGGPKGMDSYPVARAWNPEHGEWFGYSLAYLGDMDGDGIGDFAVDYNTELASSTGYVIFAGNRLWERTAGVPPSIEDIHMIAAYPNPFDDHTTVVIGDASHGDAELAIFDLLGREIRKLHAVQDASNELRSYWNGRDEAGETVPAGVYYFLVKTRDGMLKGIVVRR
jgi:hypothetical protein